VVPRRMVGTETVREVREALLSETCERCGLDLGSLGLYRDFVHYRKDTPKVPCTPTRHSAAVTAYVQKCMERQS